MTLAKRQPQFLRISQSKTNQAYCELADSFYINESGGIENTWP